MQFPYGLLRPPGAATLQCPRCRIRVDFRYVPLGDSAIMHGVLMTRITLIAIACFLLAPIIASAEEQSRIIRLSKEPFNLPDLELKGRLGADVEFSNCERISGITCTIELKSGHDLPSRIIVEEVYPDGKQHGKAWPLIYPRLSPGQRGKATFLRIHGNPERLILRGEWSGKWADKY